MGILVIGVGVFRLSGARPRYATCDLRPVIDGDLLNVLISPGSSFVLFVSFRFV